MSMAPEENRPGFESYSAADQLWTQVYFLTPGFLIRKSSSYFIGLLWGLGEIITR